MKKLILAGLLAGAFNTQAQKIQWPQQKQAVVVLTYDDALLSQLDIAVPQLKRAGFKATFFLTADINYNTIPRWRTLSEEGFELGNHTIFHPCLPSDDNPVSSASYTPYRMIREIDYMNDFLFAVDGKMRRPFAYPCAETLAGGKDYVDTLRKYRLCSYARAGGDTSAVITDFKHLDLLRIPSYGLNGGETGDQLIAFVKKVQQRGGMGVIMFHGIGGDYITVSAEAHQQLLDYLKKNEQAIWITTFQQAMDYATKAASPAIAQPPVRDPHTHGYVRARELPDGAVPSARANGNFIIGPTHDPAPESTVQANVPQGTIYHFTMDSKNSKIYPGIAREPNTFGTADPASPAKLIVTTSHPAPYTRQLAVYVPKQYVAGAAAPFIVGADGPDNLLFTVLDNLIAEGKVPAMIAISIGNGSGDAQGSERGLEYDTMNGVYAEFIEREVLPLVESKCQVKLTKDPAGRATMGGSSGGSCALIMAWYHPEWYHRVLTYSGTYINQQWPWNPKTPQGAWGFHEHLIPESRRKPLRIWMEVGDRDLFNPNVMRDGMHDWVLANENMAKVLAAKGYPYQFVFARNAKHVDYNVRRQTLPEALEWLWKDYHAAKVRQ